MSSEQDVNAEPDVDAEQDSTPMNDSSPVDDQIDETASSESTVTEAGGNTVTAVAEEPDTTGTAAEAATAEENKNDVPLLSQALAKAATGWEAFEEYLTGRYHATYGLAVTRILIGLTGLGLLLTNFNARHYAFGVGAAWNGEIAEPKSDFPNIWLFSLFHRAVTNPPLFTAMYIGLGILAVVIILGWRTRFVLPFYLVLWVSFIELNDSAGDQGDNAYRMFMIAMLFADTTRRWSLDARRRQKQNPNFPDNEGGQNRWMLMTANNLAIVVLAFQVCCIYMSGGLYKAGGDPWQHGYAVYNPLQTMQFGTWPVLSDLLTAWGPMVVAISWGSVMFQIAFPFMLFNRYTRVIALFGILSFHLGIALLMGLPWFSLTMIAVDAIFISDHRFQQVGGWVSKQVRSILAGATQART